MTTTREKLLTADDLLRLDGEGVRGEGDTLDGGDVLPGFSCAVRDVFDV